jgi:hypothetical protein
VRTLWRGALRGSLSPVCFTENGTDPISFTLVRSEADFVTLGLWDEDGVPRQPPSD